MKFLPTVDLWNAANVAAVRHGQIRLLPGQWVQCGPGPRSRFVCVRQSGDIWAVHAEGHPTAPTIKTIRFSQCVKTWTK